MKTKAIILGAVFALWGCAPEDWGPEHLSRGSGNTDDETLALGKEAYTLYCSGCHGDAGDGEGVAAKYLNPKPRDFRVGKLKFALVASGEMPRDDDYLTVITNGLKGTAMPSFRFIPHEERLAIVKYLRTFYTGKPKPPGGLLSIPKDPWVKNPDKGVEFGKKMYHGLAACSSCHPAYATKPEIVDALASFDMKFQGFRADMYKSETKDSDWGYPIKPPDFLYDSIKTGNDKSTIVKVIASGIGGTAMPNWSATLDAKQLWGLAYYVESLAAMRGFPEGRALRQTLDTQPEFTPPPPPPPPEPEPTEGAGGGDGAGGGATDDGAGGSGKTDGSKGEQ
ncbi:MAG: c-type cytochrome [Myxococcales bacterium]|nr:c-type cytochrome [Myxococcales bacterium]